MWARHRHSFLTMPNSYETNTSAAVISQQHAWEITLQSAKSLQKHTFATSFPQRAGPQRICVIVHFSSVVKSIFYSSPLYPGQFLILCWSPRSNSLFFSLKWNMRASRLPQAAGVLFFFLFCSSCRCPCPLQMAFRDPFKPKWCHNSTILWWLLLSRLCCCISEFQMNEEWQTARNGAMALSKSIKRADGKLPQHCDMQTPEAPSVMFANGL